jgi:hypothetical protein
VTVVVIFARGPQAVLMFMPLIISTGVLTPQEYGRLSAALQADLEAATREFVRSYGKSWLHNDRDRVRDELAFFHGVNLDPSPEGPIVHMGVSSLRPRQS